MPPDRRGRIHDEDVRSLRKFGQIVEATFARNLAHGARFEPSNIRGGAQEFAPENLVRVKHDHYWTTDDAVRTPDLVLEFSRPIKFNVVSLREYLPLGQRVDSFTVERWQDGKWAEFAHGTSIGNHRLLRGNVVTTEKVRLRITSASACPALSEFGLFAEPGQ